MKHTIIEWEAPNEPIFFINSILEFYCIDTYFGDFPMKSLSIPSIIIWELLFCNHELAPRGDELEADLNKFTLDDEF